MSHIKTDTSTDLARCVTQKMEQAAASSSNKALGVRLFAENMLELAPFKAVPFAGWGDWEQDSLNNRSWQWRLNWLSFLPYLMAHHRAVGDDAVLDMGKAAIESWLDTYIDTDTSYPFEFIWHDHATALRAEQLVLFAYYCRVHAPFMECSAECIFRIPGACAASAWRVAAQGQLLFRTHQSWTGAGAGAVVARDGV